MKANDILEAKEKFIHLFQLHEEALNGQKKLPIHAYKRSAIQRLSSDLDFPNRKNEDWKYTYITPSLKDNFELPDVAVEADEMVDCPFNSVDAYHLVFIDGRYSPEASSTEGLEGKAELHDLSDSLTNERVRDYVIAHLEQMANSTENAFVAMNTAFVQNGVVLIIPRGTVIDKPLHFHHISSNNDVPMMSSPHRLVVAEENSEVVLLESFVSRRSNDSAHFINLVNRIDVSKNARVSHYKWQQESSGAVIVNNTVVTQDRDSLYHSFVLDAGGRLVRNNLSCILRDGSTHTDMYGIFLGKNRQHIDNQTFIDHAYPHCSSNEMYKGILDDYAKGVFNGKVIVRPDAQKTNAFQQNNALVLSKTATMDSKPQLEIFADDVRCSHGATIGQLDEESLYYLRTRGLDRANASAMLQNAFLKEVTEHIKHTDIREVLESEIDQILER